MTFRYRTTAATGRRGTTSTLAADEFMRRFLLHVLPKGFHRIRHYGLLVSAGCKTNIARARQLIAAQWRRSIRRLCTTPPIRAPRPIIVRHARAAAAV